MKKALIILNGVIHNEIDDLNFDEYEVYAVDGGAEWAYKKGVIPVCIIGDLDSVDSDIVASFSSRKVTVISFPTEKDESDFELAMRIVAESGFQELIIAGGFGKRADHTLLNLMLAFKYVKKGLNIRFINDSENIEFIREKHLISDMRGKTVTLMALEGECRGIRLTGFKYHLENGIIALGSTLGLSNIIVEDKAIIDIKSGILTVIINK